MGLLYWFILGALAGWLASIFMKTNKSMGLVKNIIVGVIGAFIGGFLMKLLGQDGITGFNLWSILVATIGSCILIWIANKIR